MRRSSQRKFWGEEIALAKAWGKNQFGIFREHQKVKEDGTEQASGSVPDKVSAN